MPMEINHTIQRRQSDYREKLKPPCKAKMQGTREAQQETPYSIVRVKREDTTVLIRRKWLMKLRDSSL